MNTNQKTFQILDLEVTTKMVANKSPTMVSLIICLVVVMFLGGCTRVVMAIAGMDPDTVEVNGVPRVSTTAYDEIAEKIPTLATPLMENAFIIAPSYDKTEEWVTASDATQKSALVLQKHVYDSIGSRRSLSEMRGVWVPGTTYNLNVFHAHGLPKALATKGVFKTLKLERDDDPQKWMNGSGTAIIIDLSKKNQIFL